MAERPVWRGHLRLALVTCPVSLHSALRSSGNLHFHLINPNTGNRVRMVTQDAETDEELSRRDLVKGYEFEKDRYILLDDSDFDSARIESSSTMTIDKFVEREAIDPLYFDTSYYLAPDGEAGQDVYVVLREAIAKSDKVALSRVVISRRERAVAILPLETGMVLHTLHERRDLYDYGRLYERIPDATPDAEMVKLASQLIDRQGGKFEPSDLVDRYEARLREVIDAKLKGEGITPIEEEVPRRDNVIDLMAALKRSLGRDAKEEGEKAKGVRASKRSQPASQRRTQKTPGKAKSAAKRAPSRKRA